MSENIRSLNHSISWIVALWLLFLQTGCASIVNPGPEKLTVNTTPSEAQTNVNGMSGTSPKTFIVEKGKEANIDVKKEGHQSVSRFVGTTLDPWFFGNILFGGIIGIIIDLVSGNSQKLKSNSVNITLPKEEEQDTKKEDKESK